MFQRPTILNNVETYANICPIILRGAEWFSSIGSEKSKGTKVFALGGRIQNTGPGGGAHGHHPAHYRGGDRGRHPPREEIQGRPDRGPSGGCIPAEHIDTPIDYDNLAAIGTMMGSGA